MSHRILNIIFFPITIRKNPYISVPLEDKLNITLILFLTYPSNYTETLDLKMSF